MKISNMLDNNFKIMVMKVITGLGRRVDELSRNLNRDLKKYRKEPVRVE